MDAFERDLVGGIPAAALTEKHWNFLIPADHPQCKQTIFDGIMGLSRAGMGKFRSLKQNTPVVLGEPIQSKEGSSRFLCFVPRGWHGITPWDSIRWSGPEAEIRFRLENQAPLVMVFEANTFLSQRITFTLNGRTIDTFEYSGGEPEEKALEFSAESLRSENTLVIVAPDAKSPQSVGQSDDGRVMGLGLVWIRFVRRS